MPENIKLVRSNAFTKKQFHELLNIINFSKNINTQESNYKRIPKE
jgi:hypothetical protein